MEKANTDEIIKYVKRLDDEELKNLFIHYRKVIDNFNLNTLNCSVWFFCLKAELKNRNIDVVKINNVNNNKMTL